MPAIATRPPTSFRDTFAAPDRISNSVKDPRSPKPEPVAVEKAQERRQVREDAARARQVDAGNHLGQAPELERVRPPVRGNDSRRAAPEETNDSAANANPRTLRAPASSVPERVRTSALPSSRPEVATAESRITEDEERTALTRQQTADIASAYASKDDPRGRNFAVKV